MAVRIGINPIAWTNDDLPSLGGDTPVATCLSEARMAGFAGIEMGGKFPKEARELGPLLERHGLDLVSGWYDGRVHERDVKQASVIMASFAYHAAMRDEMLPRKPLPEPRKPPEEEPKSEEKEEPAAEAAPTAEAQDAPQKVGETGTQKEDR